MKDGDHKECPIIPNNAIRLNYGEDEDDNLMVAASHDSIQMFPDPRYTHLRYWDHRDQSLKAVWLAQEVLADLMDAGIPITIRESITESEYECFEHYLGQISTAAIAEIIDIDEAPLELMPGDPIEAEVQKAHEHLEAELNYFLKEWGDG